MNSDQVQGKCWTADLREEISSAFIVGSYSICCMYALYMRRYKKNSILKLGQIGSFVNSLGALWRGRKDVQFPHSDCR